MRFVSGAMKSQYKLLVIVTVGLCLSAAPVAGQTAHEVRAATFFSNLDVACDLASKRVSGKLCGPVQQKMASANVKPPYEPDPVLITTLAEVAKVLLSLSNYVQAAAKVFVAPSLIALELDDVIDGQPNRQRVDVIVREMSTVPTDGFRNLVRTADRADRILRMLAIKLD